MDRAIEFIKSIKEKDNIIIVFHNDADGCCSATMLKKFLEQTNRKNIFLISQLMPPEPYLIKRIQTTVPQKIIFLDLAIDQQYQTIKKLGGIADILIIDHHQIAKDLNNKNVVHYNPRMKKKDIYQSASYLVYSLLSKITDISDMLWIVGVGMVADYNLDNSQDLVKDVKKKYGIEGELFGSFLGRIAEMITAAKATKDLSMEQIVYVLEKAEPNSIEKVPNGEKMVEAYKKMEMEKKTILADAQNSSEIRGKIIFYEMKSKFNLRSPISTILSNKHRKSLIVIYQKDKSKIKLSGRNNGGEIDVGKTFEKAAEGLKASAGGHEAAAGATINESDWEKFKENLIKIVNS